MSDEIEKNWESETVDCPSASYPKKIAELRGGESITIKSLAASSQYHYVGMFTTVKRSRGYKLDTGEVMTLTLPVSFGRTNKISIWALPSSAGDDVCYFKLIDLEPETSAGV